MFTSFYVVGLFWAGFDGVFCWILGTTEGLQSLQLLTRKPRKKLRKRILNNQLPGGRVLTAKLTPRWWVRVPRASPWNQRRASEHPPGWKDICCSQKLAENSKEGFGCCYLFLPIIFFVVYCLLLF